MICGKTSIGMSIHDITLKANAKAMSRNPKRFLRKPSDDDSSIFQKKSLGQVFLRDTSSISKTIGILESMNIEHVVEIGPGGGALTGPLLAKNLRVTAIEKDPRFAEALKDQFVLHCNSKSLTIVNEDILKFDFGTALNGENPIKCALVGNIPYYISTPIVELALQNLHRFKCVLLMVQLEFAKRLGAAHGSKDYGSLSVFAQLRSECKIEFEISRHMFSPVPKVDSAVVCIKPLSSPMGTAEELSFCEKVSRTTFSHRRKMLRNSLSPFLSSDLKVQSPYDLNRRPETLSPNELLELSKWLTKVRIET